jgi:hypothetical protein
MDENKGQSDIFWQFIRKDWLIIAVCLVTIIVCLLAYGNAQISVGKCNAYAAQQFAEKCITGAEFANFSWSESQPIINMSHWAEVAR